MMIDKLLDIDGMQSGHVSVDLHRTDLGDLVHAAAAVVRTRNADRDVTFDIDAPAEGPVTQLTVSNTGQVIPTAERERLFQLFFRTDSALTNAVPGTGLGLSLARTIVEMHGGTIAATSDDTPLGTTITVRLPTDRPVPTSRNRPGPDRTGMRFGLGRHDDEISIVGVDPAGRHPHDA